MTLAHGGVVQHAHRLRVKVLAEEGLEQPGRHAGREHAAQDELLHSVLKVVTRRSRGRYMLVSTPAAC